MDLFADSGNAVWQEAICPGAVVLRQFATDAAGEILGVLDELTASAPLRQMQTPGGGKMSAAISACGDYGWVSDRKGYRYAPLNPMNNQPWPDMPLLLRDLAVRAAEHAGYADYAPDVCLINCYETGAKMGLHQDKDELDFSAPIVSVSLGVPATFQFGGKQRTDKPVKIPLQHGDVVVWGGESRRNFHGVLTVRKAFHPLTASRRFNLTFRKAR